MNIRDERWFLQGLPDPIGYFWCFGGWPWLQEGRCATDGSGAVATTCWYTLTKRPTRAYKPRLHRVQRVGAGSRPLLLAVAPISEIRL